MNGHRNLKLSALVFVLVAASAEAASTAQDRTLIERGRYVVQTAGCNDCHTPGYNQASGKVPEQAWLTGDSLGWRGPWGTTYATNLRTKLAGMSKQGWLEYARKFEARPPMPWFNVRAMSDEDLNAVYAFVTSLGPAGKAAPSFVPPNKVPPAPYVQFPN